MDSISLVIASALLGGLSALGLTWFGIGGWLLYLPLLPLLPGILVANSVRGAGRAGGITAAVLLWPAAVLAPETAPPSLRLLYAAAPAAYLVRHAVESFVAWVRELRRPGALRSRVVGFFWPRSRLRRAVHLLLGFTLVALAGYVRDFGRPFDAEAWRAGDRDARFRMVDDLLVRTDSLRGMSFGEVRALLGDEGCRVVEMPADGARPRCVFPLRYMLAMFVEFDSAGFVTRVSVDD